MSCSMRRVSCPPKPLTTRRCASLKVVNTDGDANPDHLDADDGSEVLLDVVGRGVGDRPGLVARLQLRGLTPDATAQVLAAAPAELLPAIEPAANASDVLRPHPHAARGPPEGLAVYVMNCSLLI